MTKRPAVEGWYYMKVEGCAWSMWSVLRSEAGKGGRESEYMGGDGGGVIREDDEVDDHDIEGMCRMATRADS